MNKIHSALLGLLCCVFFGLSASAQTTWYVDPVNGGPRTSTAMTGSTPSCNGKATTAFNASGAHDQACPFSDARMLWDDYLNFGSGYAWVMAVGDTVMFKNCTQSSPCRIAGSDDTTTAGSICQGIGVGCAPPIHMPNNITFLGENFASCSTSRASWNNALYSQTIADPSKTSYLWGGSTADGGRVQYLISIENTTGFDMECIDMSDHSNCSADASPDPGGPTPTCTNTQNVTAGIVTNTDHAASPSNGNITLKNLHIHGFQSRGIWGPSGGNWTTNNVSIEFNGSTNWDFDDGAETQSTGTLTNTNLSINFAGCAEEYPIVHTIPVQALTCIGQSNGGQGDGMGTPVTGNTSFICHHCEGLYNVQDAYDWGHAWGGTVQFDNSIFAGNNGGTIKVGPMANVLVYNNVIIEGCNRMTAAITGAVSNYNGNLGDFCRASTGGGTNVLPNSPILAGTTANTMASISCTGTTCTSSNGSSGLTVGMKLAPGGNDPGTFSITDGTTYTRQVATVTDASHFTVNQAYPANFSGQFVVVVASTPASTTSIKIYHNLMYTYSDSAWDDQCQAVIAGTQQQQSVNVKFCAGYVLDYRNNINVGISNNGGATSAFFSEVQPTIEDYNVLYNLRTGAGTGAHDIATSPLLTSQPPNTITTENQLDNLPNTLTSGSPAEAAGIAISGQTTDFLGNAWAGTPSIGPTQFMGSGAPTPATVMSGAPRFSGKFVMN